MYLDLSHENSPWQAPTKQHEPQVRDTGDVKAIAATGVAPVTGPAPREY